MPTFGGSFSTLLNATFVNPYSFCSIFQCFNSFFNVSRRELSNAYFLAKFGFDTAENEPCEVCPIPRNAAAVPPGGGSRDPRSRRLEEDVVDDGLAARGPVRGA